MPQTRIATYEHDRRIHDIGRYPAALRPHCPMCLPGGGSEGQVAMSDYISTAPMRVHPVEASNIDSVSTKRHAQFGKPKQWPPAKRYKGRRPSAIRPMSEEQLAKASLKAAMKP